MHYELFEGLVPADTLCIHGNLASNAWWLPLANALRQENKPNRNGRLLCAEWRGCGRSSGLTDESELNLPDLSEDYIELLHHLRISKAAVVGHSTGGLIALQCLRSAPDLFSRALLINPVGAGGLETTPERLEGYLDMSRNRPQCEKVIESTIHGGFPDAELGSRIVDDAFGVHPLIWQGVPRMLQAADIRSELPQIFHPVLVLHGTKDWVLPLEASRELAQSLPRGKFLALDGRGHSCNVEDPKLLLTHLSKFLFG